MELCFKSGEILLPNEQVKVDKWAVVACDQYTSQPEYWHEAEKIVGNAPSTLNIIYPEVYLGEGDNRIANIQKYMKKYIDENILQSRIEDGFVLVERKTNSGKRLGLVGILDLESYDFTVGTNALVRATEGTIQSRIPPRVHIRKGATIEAPHVMLLIDDAKRQLIEPLYEQRQSLKKLYDTNLMLNGGTIVGYAIDGEKAQEVNSILAKMQVESNGFFLAVGDGNHSLATAKTCWNNIKVSLSVDEQKNHPARFALVELVNLHSEALIFEPIHRMIFNVNHNDMIDKFKLYIKSNAMEYSDGNDITFVFKGKETGLSLKGTNGRLPLDILQHFLDEYISQNIGIEIDYVHGEDALKSLSNKDNNCGIRLGSIDKNTLFPAIKAGGVLPRKTFSMGEAYEKRYYMECRKIM